MNKKILITGGAGFLGRHLCKKLLENNKVICIDNLLTGRKKNIKEFTNLPNYTFVKHDVKNKITFKCDQIFHFASPASPIHYQKNPIDTLLTNVLGTHNMLNLALKNDCEFILASTSEIYGDPKISPQKEDYYGNVNPIGPRACYDEGKRAAETLAFDFKRKHNAKIKVLRIFNTYGPYMAKDDGRVISNFIVNSLSNTDLNIYGDGKNTRSFCYVDDLIDSIIKISKIKKILPTPINVGNDYEISIKKIAKIIIDLNNSKSKIKHTKSLINEPKIRKPDLRLLKSLINFNPKTNLVDGLIKTTRYFKDNYN